MDADVLLKGTHGGVDGIYTADPNEDPNATLIEHVSFQEVLEKNLRVMDTTAIAHCKENGMPIVVFDLLGSNNLRKLICGESIGTLVS